jgi:NADPH2:quinone reductase
MGVPEGVAVTGQAMRAAVCRKHGPPEALVVESVPRPQPGPGEVLVRVGAAAVNFPDVLIVADGYQVSVPTPFVPGSEVAGEVVALGPGVDSAAPGDLVSGATMVGAFAEYATLPAAGLMPIPPGVDIPAAAGFWVAYATAYHALRSVAAVRPGDWVVVLGAAGGVGLAAVDLAQVLGGRVIAAASTARKLALCCDRGAEHAVNYVDDDVRDAVRAIVPDGVDVVIDPVGGPTSERALRSVRWGGRFVTLGFASGDIPRVPLNLVLLKGVIVKGFEIRTFGLHAPELAERDRAELLDLLASGRVAPHIDGVFPLGDVAGALRKVADRRSAGKVLVDPTR